MAVKAMPSQGFSGGDQDLPGVPLPIKTVKPSPAPAPAPPEPEPTVPLKSFDYGPKGVTNVKKIDPGKDLTDVSALLKPKKDNTPPGPMVTVEADKNLSEQEYGIAFQFSEGISLCYVPFHAVKHHGKQAVLKGVELHIEQTLKDLKHEMIQSALKTLHETHIID